MKTSAWLIIAQTNLHVGNESTNNYGIIDKAIQRDPLTNLPCINSSSLKGAINEFVSQSKKLSAEQRKKIFGSDKTGSIGETQKGEATFFDGNILYLPQQNNDSLYQLVNAKAVIDKFISQIKILQKGDTNGDISSDIQQKITNYAKKTLCVSTAVFCDKCSDEELPIIARNKLLENGESDNLWYEQILPAQTIMGTIIRETNDTPLSTAINGQIIQIGANASIGYGYCKFIKL